MSTREAWRWALRASEAVKDMRTGAEVTVLVLMGFTLLSVGSKK